MLLQLLFRLCVACVALLPWRAEGAIEGFRLGIGLSGALLALEDQPGRQFSYLGGAFFTAANYHFGNFAVGVKSSAYLGLDRSNRKEVRSAPALADTDYVQYVSFSPSIQYFFEQGVFVNFGLASSQTGVNRSAEYEAETGKVRRKVTFQGKGIDLSLGYVFARAEGLRPMFVFFNYQNTVPQKQKLVDITDSTDAVTIARSQEADVRRIQFFSLSYGTYIL